MGFYVLVALPTTRTVTSQPARVTWSCNVEWQKIKKWRDVLCLYCEMLDAASSRDSETHLLWSQSTR